MQHKLEDINLINKRWRTKKDNQTTPTYLNSQVLADFCETASSIQSLSVESV